MATNPRNDSDKMFPGNQRVNWDDVLNSIYEAEQQQGEAYQAYFEAVRLNLEKRYSIILQTVFMVRCCRMWRHGCATESISHQGQHGTPKGGWKDSFDAR